MKKLKLLSLSLAIVLVMFTLVGCDIAPKQDDITEDLEELQVEEEEIETLEETNELEGYTLFENSEYRLHYKEDWTTDETAVGSLTARVFLSPDGASTINIIKETLPIKYTIDQYKTASLSNLKNQYTTTDFSEEKLTVDGNEAYRITYEADVSGMTVKVSQTLVVEEKSAYVITFSGTDESALEVYHNIENTFVIK